MDGKSLDITEERLNKLKEILPDTFTEGKIDWEKLQATLSKDIEFKTLTPQFCREYIQS